MSICEDKEFIKELNKHLNETDVGSILTAFSKPILNNVVNKRTGCIRVGIAHSRHRKPLTKGSLINYKSIILKFARFKSKHMGRDKPINVEIMQKYNLDILTKGNEKKYQTIVTNIRILNRNIFQPLLGYELSNPRNVASRNFDSNINMVKHYQYNNKPLLTHEEVQRTMKYLWDNCANRDHVYKCLLIFYSGLRHMEAQALTFKDILDGWSKKRDLVLIIVKRGKNGIRRNVPLFKGAPIKFFNDYFVPYLSMKILLHLQQIKMKNHNHDYNNNNNEDVDKDIINKKVINLPIFSNSTYQSTQKEFKKALKIIVNSYGKNNNEEEEEEDEEEEGAAERNLNEVLKGAGIHSIRAEYSTRTLMNLYLHFKNPFIVLRYVKILLGQKSDKVTLRHYLNLGYDFKKNNVFEKVLNKYNTDNNITTTTTNNNNNNNNNDNNNNNNQLFQSLASSHGEVIQNLFKDNKKNHTNMNNFFNVYDNVNIFDIENDRFENNNVFYNNYDDDDDNNNNDDNDNNTNNDNDNNNDDTDDDDDDDDDFSNNITII